MLEEDITVFVRTTHCRILRIKSTVTECLYSIHIAHFLQILVIPCLDLLDLMRCTETVEEVDERNSALDSSEMSNSSKIHNFLWVCLSEHCKTGLTTSVNVRVVTENVKCVRSNAACRNMEHARKQLACDLVHIRDHKEKALRSSICCSKSTGIQRTVNSTCCTGFGLHLFNLNGSAENVLYALRRPLIDIVCHRAGRCDRINTGNFREGIRNICSGIITVHCFHFSFDSHRIDLLSKN